MTATLDIATVQAFLLVAALQSFTRAAEVLGTTQAAASLKLQRLETLLGKRLVDRPPRRRSPRPAASAPSPCARSTKPGSPGASALSAAASPRWLRPRLPALRSHRWRGGSRLPG